MKLRLQSGVRCPVFKLMLERKGSQIAEAAIVMPILILTAMLLLRLFTFYLEILSSGINEHMTALEAWDSYRGAGFRSYTAEREVGMIRGGLLHMNLTKDIHTHSYMINEDILVRAGDAVD